MRAMSKSDLAVLHVVSTRFPLHLPLNIFCDSVVIFMHVIVLQQFPLVVAFLRTGERTQLVRRIAKPF